MFARPLQQRRDAGMGIRARRRDSANRTYRAAPREHWHRHRSRHRCRDCGTASSCSSTTGCAPTLTAAPSSLCLNRGGSASQDLFSTTPDGVSCLRLCARSSISLKPLLSQSRRGRRNAGGSAQTDLEPNNGSCTRRGPLPSISFHLFECAARDSLVRATSEERAERTEGQGTPELRQPRPPIGRR